MGNSLACIDQFDQNGNPQTTSSTTRKRKMRDFDDDDDTSSFDSSDFQSFMSDSFKADHQIQMPTIDFNSLPFDVQEEISFVNDGDDDADPTEKEIISLFDFDCEGFHHHGRESTLDNVDRDEEEEEMFQKIILDFLDLEDAIPADDDYAEIIEADVLAMCLALLLDESTDIDYDHDFDGSFEDKDEASN